MVDDQDVPADEHTLEPALAGQCTRCRVARFCSSACMRLSWPAHKQCCARWAEEGDNHSSSAPAAVAEEEEEREEEEVPTFLPIKKLKRRLDRFKISYAGVLERCELVALLEKTTGSALLHAAHTETPLKATKATKTMLLPAAATAGLRRPGRTHSHPLAGAAGSAGQMKRALEPAPQDDERKRQRAEKLRQWAAKKALDTATATAGPAAAGEAAGSGSAPAASAAEPASGAEPSPPASGDTHMAPLVGALRMAPLARVGGARGKNVLGAAGAMPSGFGPAAGEAAGAGKPLRMFLLDDDEDDERKRKVTWARGGRGVDVGALDADDGDDEDEGEPPDVQRAGNGGGGAGAAVVEEDPLDAFMSSIASVGGAIRSTADARREEAGDASAQAISLDEIFAGSAGHGSFLGGSALGFDDVMTDTPQSDDEGAAERGPARKRTQAAAARKAMQLATEEAAAEAVGPSLADEDFHRAFLEAMRKGPDDEAAQAAAAETAGEGAGGRQRFFDDDNGEGDDIFGLNEPVEGAAAAGGEKGSDSEAEE
ncbi:hypothetical protein T492DRAFT_864006, partial [Pavlovales sp. CCMP2436]